MHTSILSSIALLFLIPSLLFSAGFDCDNSGIDVPENMRVIACADSKGFHYPNDVFIAEDYDLNADSAQPLQLIMRLDDQTVCDYGMSNDIDLESGTIVTHRWTQETNLFGSVNICNGPISTSSYIDLLNDFLSFMNGGPLSPLSTQHRIEVDFDIEERSYARLTSLNSFLIPLFSTAIVTGFISPEEDYIELSYINPNSRVLLVLRENTVNSTVDADLKDKVTLFPNPVNDILNIQFESGVDTQLQVSILNASGQQIAKTTKELMQNTIQIDVSPYPSGFYVVQFLNLDGRVVGTKNLMIQR